jgi:tetratricopeptide (TPR) repeat protein
MSANRYDREMGDESRGLGRNPFEMGTRGGLGTILGIDYQVDLAVRMTLELIERELDNPAARLTITLEAARAGGEGVEKWDIAICQDDRAVEAKANPTADDVRDFVDRVAVTDFARAEFVYGRGSGRSLNALERLVGIAKRAEAKDFEKVAAENGVNVKALRARLGDDAQERLQRVIVDATSPQMVEREVIARARQLSGPDGQTVMEFLYKRLTKSRGVALAVGDLISDLQARGVDVRQPLFPNATEFAEPIRQALRVLQELPQPLPVDILALSLSLDIDDLERELAPLHDSGIVVLGDGTVSLAPLPASFTVNATTTLQGVLIALRDRLDGGAKGDPYLDAHVDNLCMLMTLLEQFAPADVAATFGTLDKLLKRRGDVALVFRVADLAIRAAKRAPQSIDAARAEARALICGRSWAYQRVGALHAARDDGEASLHLGMDLDWAENTAFCHKCLGRLLRLEAEDGAGDRDALLRQSAEYLELAVAEFDQLGNGIELGDALSLLGRTNLVAGDVEKAAAAADRARVYLTDRREKDWVDLQILLGDLAAARNADDEAFAFYGQALSTGPHDSDGTLMRARALIQRAKLSARNDHCDAAAADLKEAVEILRDLEDFRQAGAAELELLKLEGRYPKAMAEPEVVRLLNDHAPLVQVLAIEAREHELEAQTQDESVLAMRKEATVEKWKALIADARKEAVHYRRSW